MNSRDEVLRLIDLNNRLVTWLLRSATGDRFAAQMMDRDGLWESLASMEGIA